MRMTPVIAVVDDETMTRVRPLLNELVARLEPLPDFARRNGWTAESLAWGLLVAAASRCDLELG